MPPQPASVVSVARTPVQPALRAASLQLGDWSPDGGFLVFSLPEGSGDQPVLRLYFLDAATGAICPAGGRAWAAARSWEELRERFAWLPDGRLLLVTANGEMRLFRPCASDEDLAGRYPATFTQVTAYDARRGRVLLRAEAAYWLLDAVSLEVRPIPAVSPNPYEFHRDFAAWSPTGAWLAIARLDGREAGDGTTLYIVDAQTGGVARRLSLDNDSDWSAPWFEWVTDAALVTDAGGTLIDLRAEPPTVTDLNAEVFLLDTSDFASSATLVAGPDAFIAVRVNHPRNQNAYLYHLGTGQVEVLQSESDLVLFLGDRQWTQLPMAEFPPGYRDEYELVWLDAPQAAPRRLAVEGHVPRNYPTLSMRYLPASSRMAFASSQGVSLVSIPEGDLLKFWDLAGGGGSPHTHLLATPDGRALVADAAGVGLYFIPLSNP
jgi:hypothetical protein